MRMRATISAGLLAALAVGTVAVSPAQAVPEPDQLAVVVVGDGETYGNVAGPAALQLIDSTGAAGEHIEIPTVGEGDQHDFTIGVDRDQAGALQQSADHTYVTVGGYDQVVGGDTNSSLAPEIERVIARIGAEGTVDTSTSLGAAYNERHIRGVVSVDGSRYWTGGHGGDSVGDAQGSVLTIEHGDDDPQVLVSGGGQLNNGRVPVIHDEQLYVSSDRSDYNGVNAVGTGTPTDPAGLTLIAEAPAGREVAHDFAFIGGYLYVNYTDGSPAMVRYAQEDGAWVAESAFAGEFWGLTGRVAADEHVLYATRGSSAQNELVVIVTDPEDDFATAQLEVLATAEANKAFRGVSFAPGFEPGAEAIYIPANPTLAWDVNVAGGTGNALSAVLGATNNPVATGQVGDPEGLAVEVTARSANQDIIADNDISTSVDSSGALELAATPRGLGITSIAVTVTADDGRETTGVLTYGVAASSDDDTVSMHFGVADASAAYDVGDGHFVMADDDSNQIRLYGPTSGLPVAEFDFSGEIDHPTDRTFDIEAAARIGDTIYWVGSLGNSRSGNYWPHRDIAFATTITGSGASTELEFAGEVTGFRDALVEWDNSDAHGAGAGAFQFERATSDGFSAEGPNSLNLEGATIAPDGTTLWLGFRSPLVPVAADLDSDPAGDLALVIAIDNIAEALEGEPIEVGEYFTLDLDGRAIRDITETDDGNYLISAGSADDSGNFALFGWSGDPSDAPIESEEALGLEGWDGSYEAILGAQSLVDGTVVRLLLDVGTVDIYGNGTEAQDLARELMMFPSQGYTLDFDGAFATEDEPGTGGEDGTDREDEGEGTPGGDDQGPGEDTGQGEEGNTSDDEQPGGSDGQLPTTGVELSGQFLAVTVLLLTAGMGAALIARRRLTA